jgi:hypothetical protein
LGRRTRECRRGEASGETDRAANAFDHAVTVKRTPVPFGHKFYPHLRPYFVETCRSLLADGHPEEAAGFAIPYFINGTQIMLVDGPAEERPRWAEPLAAWLAANGWDTAGGRARLLEGVRDLAGRISALVDTSSPRIPRFCLPRTPGSP